MNFKLQHSWRNLLTDELNDSYFNTLIRFVNAEYSQNVIYPPKEDIFKALNLTSPEKIKVVIIGQDPYHGKGQANGLAFSVNQTCNIPPSLRNIFKEIQNNFEDKSFKHGDLENWARQGVLLLNSILTVKAGEAGSHKNKGWEKFTDSVITKLSQIKKHLVFMLWGNYAKKKKEIIDKNKHLILKTTHPSPFSAHKGFLGCGHFKKTNNYLKKHDLLPINW